MQWPCPLIRAPLPWWLISLLCTTPMVAHIHAVSPLAAASPLLCGGNMVTTKPEITWDAIAAKNIMALHGHLVKKEHTSLGFGPRVVLRPSYTGLVAMPPPWHLHSTEYK